MALDTSDLDGATIVFDLDGTLVDTAPDLMAAMNAVLAQEGVAPVTLEAVRTMIGGGARAMLMRGFAAGGRPLAEPEISHRFERFLARYRAHVADLGRPFPGVAKALDSLMVAGARLAVCTNKRTDLALAVLEAVGMLGRFAAVVGPDSAAAAKPDPRHLLAALERAGGRADRAVMVGDTIIDARAARAVAIPLILVDFGYGEAPARELGPDILISHFDQLHAACQRLLAARPALSGDGVGAIGPSPAGDA